MTDQPHPHIALDHYDALVILATVSEEFEVLLAEMRDSTLGQVIELTSGMALLFDHILARTLPNITRAADTEHIFRIASRITITAAAVRERYGLPARRTEGP